MPIARLSLLFALLILLTGWKAPTRNIAGKVTLEWTAPGDDSLAGAADAYDIRFSNLPITEENFLLATPAGTFKPRPAGALERFKISGLLPKLDYYFAVRTRDEQGNWSAVSNIAFLPGLYMETESRSTARILDFSLPRPNPARSSTRFRLSLPERTDVKIEAFDAAGRRVRTLTSGERAAGTVDLDWDLADDRGRPLAPGIYLVHAEVGETSFMRVVAIVR